MSTSIERFNSAKSAYVAGDFAKAKILLDNVIEESESSPFGVGARYLRGRGYEDGAFSDKPDLLRAYEDFEIVKAHAVDYGSDGLLGCARVLFELDARGNFREIVELCEKAVSLDSNVKAMMLLGRIYDQVVGNGGIARRWYLRAYLQGLPWGMRYFARSHARDGNAFRSIFAHAFATLTSPVLVLLYGARSPFK
ncbi:hypothetical protein [Pseudoxanthomonas winnipegensis]|uniref:hypothetical protein n=1 Tax=Pseudoxanthomonas winnipegensis TaxID=2480810 RepID=UPI0030F3BD40